MIPTFNTMSELISTINDKIVAYKDKFGKYPKTIVFDSVSKIMDTCLDNCAAKETGFKTYTRLNAEVHELTEYIQNTLIASDMNVVIISHALYDADTTKYNLIGKGDFSKRGGFIAETDYGIFIETKSNKRIIHFRSTKFPARTLAEDDPDSIAVDDFDLQVYLDKLVAAQSDANEHAL